MSVEIAHAAFVRHAFSEAYAAFKATDALSAFDVERFGLVAHLLGHNEEGVQLWERAHQSWLEGGEPAAAGLTAFWLAMNFMDRGEMAHAGGWLARAHSCVDETTECAVHGYLLIPQGLQLTEEGEPGPAKALFEKARALGERFHDSDLVTLACLGRGQALVDQGDIAEGAGQLDEAMVLALANTGSPLVMGIVYCAVIGTCLGMFDLRRAQEWTDALGRWCDAQPDIVPFRGRCQLFRSEILQAQGDWDRALEAAQEAETGLAGPPAHPAIGAAYYQQGEVHRLRGSVNDADAAYRKAEQWGRRPEPGRALLRLAQRRHDAAAAAITHALHESHQEPSRALLLVAAVEIFLALKDITAARKAADELNGLAAALDVPLVRAAAGRAEGAVRLREGDARTAVPPLRAALETWQAVAAPYEAARTHALLGAAARDLGDLETAEAHIAAADETFRRLGAASELQTITSAGIPATATSGLTPREVDVLKLVATGMTNRAIAANLVISEKTVANHVGNILGKLALSSRAAATAYAYEHHMV